jgi:hypothetical protein
MADPVKSAYCGIDNGVLIAKIAPLYLAGAHTVLDVTFGAGGFWTHYRPDNLICHDLFTIQEGEFRVGVDWRKLPEADESVDRFVFDPPYVAPGGRSTSGPKFAGMRDAYGMHSTEKDPRAQWAKILLGCEEAWRVLEPGGLLLFKAMDYVSSGRMQWATRWAWRDIEAIGKEWNAKRGAHVGGFRLVDEIVLVQPGATGMQPKGRRQVHARAAHSVLMIFRKPRTRKRKAKP